MNKESRVFIGIVVILLSAFLVYDVATSMAGYRGAPGYYAPYGYSPGYGGYGGYGGMMMNGMMGYGYRGYDRDFTQAYPYGRGMMGYHGYPGYGYGLEKLTDEQRARIQEKISELQEKGAYPWEIRAEVFKLLKEFGVLGNESASFYPGYDYRYPYRGGMMGDMMDMMHGGMYGYGPGYGWYDRNTTRAFPYGMGGTIGPSYGG